jgi:hypothetical protein
MRGDAMKKQISVANLVMLIGGAITFLFSFFDFIGSGDIGTSAWGSGLFPLATIPAILGGAMVVICVLEQVGTKLPDEILTFNWKQILVTWGITSLAIMVAYLVLDKSPLSFKFCVILMLLGSIAMAVGSILAILGKGDNLLSLPGGSSGTSGTTTSGTTTSGTTTSGTTTPPPPPPSSTTPPPPPPPPPPPS